MDELQLAGEFEELELQARITWQVAGHLGSVMHTLCTAAVICITAPFQSAFGCALPWSLQLELPTGSALWRSNEVSYLASLAA